MTRDLTAGDCTLKSTRSLWAVGVGIAVFALILRFGFVVEQYDGDMELFVYMGKMFAQGQRIGIELVDNKLPLVAPLMWPAYALIGGWWAGYAILSIVLSVVATLAITEATAIVRPSSRYPTLAMTAVWLGFPIVVSAAFKLEHVQVCTGALAAYFIIRCWKSQRGSDAFWAGLIAGIGSMAKPTAVSVLVGALVALLVWREVDWKTRCRLAAWGVAGVGLAGAMQFAYLLKSGALWAMPALVEQIHQYNSNSVWVQGVTLVKFGCLIMIVGGPLLIRGLAERRQAERREIGEWIPTIFATTWLLIELTGIVMQGRLYSYHFLPLMVPAGLVFGLIPRKPSALRTIIAPLPTLMASTVWTFVIVLQVGPPDDRLAANEFVKSHAAAGDGVWMDENARILVETDLKSGSRIPLTFLFSNYDDAPQKFEGMMIEDFETRTPRWIVMANDWKTREEFHQVNQAEYSRRPRRAENLMKAWVDLTGYIESHYTRRARYGTLDVMERLPATQTAKAE